MFKNSILFAIALLAPVAQAADIEYGNNHVSTHYEGDVKDAKVVCEVVKGQCEGRSPTAFVKNLYPSASFIKQSVMLSDGKAYYVMTFDHNTIKDEKLANLTRDAAKADRERFVDGHCKAQNYRGKHVEYASCVQYAYKVWDNRQQPSTCPTIQAAGLADIFCLTPRERAARLSAPLISLP